MAVTILGSTTDGVKIRSVRGKKADIQVIDSPTFTTGNGLGVLSNSTLLRFYLFWALMDSIQLNGYMRSAVSVIGRTTIGTWWNIVKDEDAGGRASNLQKKRLYDFYSSKYTDWTNINDYRDMTYKLSIAAMYLRYFGQAAFHIVRNGQGAPLGLDFLHGFVAPNIDRSGSFKSPAFYQFPTRDASFRVDLESAKDVVYILNPELEGFPSGGSDAESLVTFNMPLDLYLQTSARNYLENRDLPEAIWQVNQEIDDDAFDELAKLVENKYRGAENMGKAPIVVAGELDVKPLTTFPTELPYAEARKDTRTESLAAVGTSGAKIGITEDMTSSNLKEIRREYHETSMVPLFKQLEEAFYRQVNVREFNSPGWRFAFNQPDFLTAVEEATVHMRYLQYGVLNPNEVREELGLAEREGGEIYYMPPNQQNQQGSPPEGRPQEPDAPANTGEPTNDDQDPPRGDQHNDSIATIDLSSINVDNVLDELKAWKKFELRRFGKDSRDFNFESIPEDVGEIINYAVKKASSEDEVKGVFDTARKEIEQWLIRNGTA